MPVHRWTTTDKINKLTSERCSNCGHRRSWHIRGTVCACHKCPCKMFEKGGEDE